MKCKLLTWLRGLSVQAAPSLTAPVPVILKFFLLFSCAKLPVAPMPWERQFPLTAVFFPSPSPADFTCLTPTHSLILNINKYARQPTLALSLGWGPCSIVHYCNFLRHSLPPPLDHILSGSVFSLRDLSHRVWHVVGVRECVFVHMNVYMDKCVNN